MTVRLERPNRLAMIVDEGVMGMTVVSDGKQLHAVSADDEALCGEGSAGRFRWA